MMKRNSRKYINKTREMLQKELLESLEKEQLPWEAEWSIIRTPFQGYNYNSGRKYSGINILLLEIVSHRREYISNAWMTYNQIKERHDEEANSLLEQLRKNHSLLKEAGSRDGSFMKPEEYDEAEKELKESLISGYGVANDSQEVLVEKYNQELAAIMKIYPDVFQDSGMKALQPPHWHLENAKNQGVPIEFYQPYDKKNHKNLTIREYDDIMKGDDVDRKHEVTIIIKNYTVFNGSLIKHIRLKEEERISCLGQNNERTVDAEMVDDILNTYMRNEGIRLNEDISNSQAYYAPGTDSITLPSADQFSSFEGYLATKAHEVIHSTGTKNRLNRDQGGMFGDERYAIEELVAETGSVILCAELGISDESRVKNHTAYFQSWASQVKDEPERIFQAIKNADRAVDFVEKRGEMQQKIKLSREAALGQSEKGIFL